MKASLSAGSGYVEAMSDNIAGKEGVFICDETHYSIPGTLSQFDIK